MQFDQLGHLIEVQYPSGGYTQYDYQTGTFEMAEGQNSCSGLTMWEIKDKYECTITTGCSPSQQYQTTYTPTLQSGTYNGPPFNQEMVETDKTTGNYTQHNFGTLLQWSNYAPKETATYYYNSAGTLLRNIQTTYIPSNLSNPDLALPGTITTTLDDVHPTDKLPKSLAVRMLGHKLPYRVPSASIIPPKSTNTTTAHPARPRRPHKRGNPRQPSPGSTSSIGSLLGQ